MPLAWRWSNFFNRISRHAVFKALKAHPQFNVRCPHLAMLCDAAIPARLWADLGGGREWEDIPSRLGVQQGCTFGSFLAALALQPVLEKVAAELGAEGMVVAVTPGTARPVCPGVCVRIAPRRACFLSFLSGNDATRQE